ncbi:MAG: Hsp20/alpha crystallin family protein [Pirellulaceae bacterium]
MDLSENDEALKVRVDLPGVKMEDIDVQVNANQLTITAERKEEQETKEATTHRLERRIGRFSRSLALPCEVDETAIAATYQEGVLTVTLPKSEKTKTRRITVKPK